MSNRYTIGCAVLGGDVTIPKAGITYTDEPTVRAVQNALKAKGFDPGTIDGVFGPKTSAAISAMQSAAGMGQTGVIDYGVLAALGVEAPQGGQATKSTATSILKSISSAFTPAVAQPLTPTAAQPAQPLNFWTRPAWDGAPIKGWQLVFGTTAGLLAALGIAGMVRR